MPRLLDRGQIRRILETDRPWAAYALADLEPGFFERTTWFAADGATSALALVYSAFATPVLICVGPAAELRSVLNEVDVTLYPPVLYLVVQPDVLPLVAERYRISDEKVMHRMVLDPQRYQPAAPITADSIVRLGLGDLDAVRRLYEDGDASGESPDWFLPEMLASGVYFGIREGDGLAAIAGTHVVAQGEGVACVGNIYTRRDRRGRGLGTQVTAAVVGQLMVEQSQQGDARLPQANAKHRTIVLNVQASNAAAIHVYTKLGFRRYCDFIEAVAVKPGGAAGADSLGEKS